MKTRRRLKKGLMAFMLQVSAPVLAALLALSVFLAVKIYE
jgi:hypothetical protein